jgi:hypothetical protein
MHRHTGLPTPETTYGGMDEPELTSLQAPQEARESDGCNYVETVWGGDRTLQEERLC